MLELDTDGLSIPSLRAWSISAVLIENPFKGFFVYT